MKNILRLQKPSGLEWAILAAIGSIIVVIALCWTVWAFIDSQKTYPLGNKLTYLGKESSSCHIGPTPTGFDFGNCTKTTSYYYATDMSMADTIGYFRNAHPEPSGYYASATSGTEGVSWSHIQGIRWQSQPMVFTTGYAVWYLTYYDDGRAVARALSRTVSKEHVYSHRCCRLSNNS